MNFDEISLENSTSSFRVDDIMFWERLRFDWISNVSSISDVTMPFFDFVLSDDNMPALETNLYDVLSGLLMHWKDMANRFQHLESLHNYLYKSYYCESLSVAGNFWEFLQLELIRQEENLHQSQNISQSIIRSHSMDFADKLKSDHIDRKKSDIYCRRSLRNLQSFDEGSIKNPSIISDKTSDQTGLEFVDYLSQLAELNRSLAFFIILDGPRSIPLRFRSLYKNLIKVFCKVHNTFLPIMLKLRKDRRLRPTEFDGKWSAQASCCICYQENGGFINQCCGQTVCEICFSRYVNSQVSDLGRIHVECPITNCRQPLKFQSIWVRLTEENRKRYEIIKDNMEQSDTKRLCPHCMVFYELSDEEKEILHKKKYRKLHKTGFNVKCKRCAWQWCFKCQTPVHALSCKKNLSADKQLLKWAKEKNIEDIQPTRKARKCPKCHILVERNGGCPHMECSKCKCSWCYSCGHRRIKIKNIPGLHHDSRYFILGCSNILFPNHPHLRRFVRVCVMFGVTFLIVPASALAIALLAVLGVVVGIPIGTVLVVRKLRRLNQARNW